ncbi:MAG: DUF1028 domain-containing protein [Alphaproteobacteria bacterium]
MTFSILAVDRQSGSIGGAAATGNIAVGAWVLAIEARAGGVASQGLSVSALWKEQAIAGLRRNDSADQTVRSIVEADPGRGSRQLAVLDRHGRAAAWTGGDNHDVKGHVTGDGYVIAGNWLGAEGVLTAMEAAFIESSERDFGERLLAVLDAGVRAGGDDRGMQSAALRTVSEREPPLDLRIDDDRDPLGRLATLYQKTRGPDYAAWLKTLPTLEAPHRC